MNHSRLSSSISIAIGLYIFEEVEVRLSYSISLLNKPSHNITLAVDSIRGEGRKGRKGSTYWIGLLCLFSGKQIGRKTTSQVTLCSQYGLGSSYGLKYQLWAMNQEERHEARERIEIDWLRAAESKLRWETGTCRKKEMNSYNIMSPGHWQQLLDLYQYLQIPQA